MEVKGGVNTIKHNSWAEYDSRNENWIMNVREQLLGLSLEFEVNS